MSSFNRAERRRQAREAAKTDRVDQRGAGDCMRAAVATYLGVPYEQTAKIEGLSAATFYADWDAWLEGRNLTMQLFSWAPGHLRRWIAIVERGSGLHSVVMAGPDLHHDPALPAERVERIERSDVIGALVIADRADAGWAERIADEGERGFTAGDPRMWRLERLLESDWAVEIHRARGEDDKADAMQARLAEAGAE